MRRARLVTASQMATIATARSVAIGPSAIHNALWVRSAAPFAACGLSAPSRFVPGPVEPVSLELPVAALVASRPADWDDAGDVVGVGSNGTQPMPWNQTSTHEWASKSRTLNSLVVES